MLRIRFLLAGLLVLVLAGGILAALRPAPEEPGGFITDAQGRALVAHGFSTDGSAKESEDGLPAITESDIAQEHDDMGTNFVRLLISWRAVEPAPGEYDQDYLDDLSEIIGWYAERDYAVMLDMHQDLWGVAIENETGQVGNGAPGWATHTDGHDVGTHDQWELHYLDSAVMRSFDHFWATTGDYPDLMEHYAHAWQAVAEYFSDEPAVVAYDLMNEPYGGTRQGPPFEAGSLTELYQRSTDAIRQVDADSWLCLEPQALGYNWGLPTALADVTDPRDGSDHLAFCPHLYPLPMDLGGGYSGSTRTQVDATLDAWIDHTQREAARMGDVPVILGEFGLDTTRDGALDYTQRVYSHMDGLGASVAYWSRDDGDWGPYDEQHEPRNLVEVLNRPYPRAVAGTPVGWHSEDGLLELQMIPDASIDAPTEVYLPPQVFADGVDVDGAALTSWDSELGRAQVDIPADGDTRTITFTPAEPAHDP